MMRFLIYFSNATNTNITMSINFELDRTLSLAENKTEILMLNEFRGKSKCCSNWLWDQLKIFRRKRRADPDNTQLLFEETLLEIVIGSIDCRINEVCFNLEQALNEREYLKEMKKERRRMKKDVRRWRDFPRITGVLDLSESVDDEE